MQVKGRIIKSAVALAVVTLTGTVGYTLVEGWTVFDSVYMTIVTITTVGYEEVNPLSTAGRVFSMLLMVGGVGVMLYILTATVQTVVEGEIVSAFVRRRRMKARWTGLNRHFIVCGFGRVGQEVVRALAREKVQLVVVDANPESITLADEQGLLYVQGDATLNETLKTAGISNARGLVTALGQESDNVLVTLSAKALNHGVTVVARSASPEAAEKLQMAGADRVVSPYRIGGRRLALSAIRPLAVDFFDKLIDSSGADMRLAEVEVTEGSPLAMLTVKEFNSRDGGRILAIARRSGQMVVTPPDSTLIEPGDDVMLYGPNTELERLEGKE